jgi:hypothetical protein
MKDSEAVRMTERKQGERLLRMIERKEGKR